MSEIEKLRGLLREIRRHNSSGLTRDMQARIDAALSQQAEQQPVAYARQIDLDDPEGVMFVSLYEYRQTGYSVPLYAAPIAQTAPQPKHTHANKHKPHCLLLDPEEAQCHCTCGLEPAQTAPRGETK